jgi:flagellar M-ring protein FliF
VIISPKPGSDITQNRKKIEGIQKVLKFAVEGLRDENIVITDQNGLQLNDFEGMAASDRLDLVAKGNKLIQTEEAKLQAKALQSLQNTFTADRVRDINVKIDMDMSQKTISTDEYYPITIKERTPGLAYDDSELAKSITISESTSKTAWEGTGFNPEGPAGVEGQTAPAFRDMSNLNGKVEQTTLTHNEVINNRKIQEEKSPSMGRRTASVNIDGTWKLKYDEKGNPVTLPDGTREREYTPLPAEDLSAARALIQDAIGYDAARGDSVTVQNIQFDRTREFTAEDAAFAHSRQVRMTLLIFMAGLVILLIAAAAIRMISREMKKRKQKREEEIAQQQEAIRISAMQEPEPVDVSMSVEQRRSKELQENAINMAKDHPGDVAQLIRTWLMEE